MDHIRQQKHRKQILPVLLLLIITLLLTACSRAPEHGGRPEPGGDDWSQDDWQEDGEQEDDRYAGMIAVDTGDGDIRWVRDYENVPVSTLKADQFEIGEGTIEYTGDEYTVMHGIDVSTFQGEIDWAAVAADGIEFAMLRIGGRGYGSGEIYEDDSFPVNLQGATENGIRAGAYFFSQAVTPEEAEEEADYVIAILRDLPEGSVTMPVAFDWEMVGDYEARTVDIDEETLTSCAAAFCAKIAEAGYQPIVYAYRYLAYDMYDLERLQPYPLWISTLDYSPSFYYAFSMWQYTETGYVDGIQTTVDLNLYFIPKTTAPADPE